MPALNSPPYPLRLKPHNLSVARYDYLTIFLALEFQHSLVGEFQAGHQLVAALIWCFVFHIAFVVAGTEEYR